MAMTRLYSRVKHRPAVLFYSQQGQLIALVLGIDLGVFAGMNLRVGQDLTVTSDQEPRQTDEA